MQESEEKKTKKPTDPLDMIMVVLTCVLIIAIILSVLGYFVYVVIVLSLLTALAWIKAPRRSWPTAEEVSSHANLEGKVALVTGTTSGIGFETARVLALRGAHVILASRNEIKLKKKKSELEELLAAKGVKAKFTSIKLDIGDLASVKNCAEEFQRLNLPLHYLVCNAGIMAIATRQGTKQDYESQVGTNHLGHYLLIRLFLPILKNAGNARVVILTSSANRLANPSFLDEEYLETKPYNPWTAYGNSKLCNLMTAKKINELYSDQGIHAFSVHPGGIHTGLQGHVSLWTMIKWTVVTPFFFKSIEQGAGTTIVCTVGDESMAKEHGGKYFNDCKPTNTVEKWTKRLGGKEAYDKLWNVSEQLCSEFL